jgi:hypothetical protein
MSAGVTEPRPVRAGWTLPVLVLAIVVVVAGAIEWRAAQPAHTFCNVFNEVGPLLHLPGHAPLKVPSCAGVERRYDLARAVSLLAAAAALIAFVGRMRRSRKAAAAGAPWRSRRVMEAGARWVDRRLPGRTGSTPRLRPGFLLALSALLLLVGGMATASALRKHRAGEELASYDRAEAALARLALPSGIQRSASGCGESAVCARSTLTPKQVQPDLEKLLHGRAQALILLPCIENICPVTVYGHIDGYPALAMANRHLLLLPVKHGRPPKGAVPAARGRGRLFYLGSNISIGAIHPEAEE